MQIKFSTMFFWLFSMADSTVSGRFHCEACGKRQTTSWRNVNNAICQVHCEVRFTLGKQEIPARPNSVDVRVGDNLKVLQVHPSIARIQLHHPKYQTSAGTNSVFSGFAMRPYQMFAARKRYEHRVSEQAAGVNRGVLWVRITSPIILSLSVEAT